MNFDRLENLIVALRDAKREDFTMKAYARCRTPACVFGHYAARGDLQDEFRIDYGSVVDSDGEALDYNCPEVLDHFGIDEDKAFELFATTGCGEAQTPAEAIAYIRAFIDRHKAVEP